jgi:hypothetical protein
MLKANHINNITYTNNNDETSDKKVIPIQVPLDAVLTIDVSDMDVAEAEQMLEYVQSYNEYYELHLKKVFKFEDFVEQSFNVELNPKWRKLMTSKITFDE